MDFLKKHYEKVLLGVVLLGLTVGAAALPLMISRERASQDELTSSIIKRKPVPLKDLQLTSESNAVKRTSSRLSLDFSSTNKLFNSFPWQKTTDGRLIKVIPGNVGPEAVVVTNIEPLYLTVTLDSVTPSDSGPRYIIGIQNEAGATPSQRRKHSHLATPDSKTDVFVVRSVKGSPDNPTSLTLQLNDTGETATVAKGKPFKRVDGYMADLKYEPEKRTWNNQRVGSVISFDGEIYNIVAISKDEVIISARSNNKKTVIPYKPAP